ncbi:MAG: hypothetical protein JSW68_10390 [Burkholderiales bacterium]|nr:MAG: hypothetical protein JSW68_10390 [Burkholderiales bacterium]
MRTGAAARFALIALALSAIACGSLAVVQVGLQWGPWAAAAVAGTGLGLVLVSLAGPGTRRPGNRRPGTRRPGAASGTAWLQVDARGRGRLVGATLPGGELPVTLVSLRMSGRFALLGLSAHAVAGPDTARGARACMHYLTGIAANDARTWHRLAVWATWCRRGEASRRS